MLGNATWTDLIEKDDFFYSYRYYMQVVATSESQEQHLKWSGLVESKLRQLIMKLEFNELISVAHPFIKSFESSHVYFTQEEKNKIAHGHLPPKKTEEELKALVKEGQETNSMFVSIFYVGIQLEESKDETTGKAPKRKLDISWPISEFTNIVKSWDSYLEETMGITVQFIKRFYLILRPGSNF